MSAAYAIRHPFLEPCPDSAPALAAVPRDWTYVADDARRHQPNQLELFPSMRDFYAASTRTSAPHAARVAGFPPLPTRRTRRSGSSCRPPRAPPRAGGSATTVPRSR